MSRPLVLIHGYSSNGEAFDVLRSELLRRGINTTDVDVCTYVSLNNEIGIKDIAEGLDRAFRAHKVLKDDDQEFDAVVHSTGILVLRSWLTNYGLPAQANKRLRRLKHLIGLAPATWGSPQAHKGRSWLGALVKGDRHLGPDFLNAGDRVLDGLELGSQFTWDLAHQDLLGEHPYYDLGADTPYVTIFIGNRPYDGLSSVANEPGTDGTVRWAGCGLNTRKIRIDLTRTGVEEDGKPVNRVSMSPWADRLDIPMIAVDGRNHSSLVSDPDPVMVDLMADFLKVNEEGGETYDEWLGRARVYGEKGLPRMLMNPGGGGQGLAGEAGKFFGHLLGEAHNGQLDGWQQFIVYARDERGDGVSDYMVEILHKDETGAWVTFTEMCAEVHAYAADPSFRCFHVRLPRGALRIDNPLRVRIHASTGTELMTYQGYGSEAKQLTASSEPVEIDLATGGDESIFFPFTTTLIEIVLNREPLPFNAESRILRFLERP